MPTLVFEHDGHQRAGALNGRVLIGRRLSHGVVIADPAVSRLHAWIDNREGSFVLTDAGSRTGTFVNGNAIVRYELQHGDTIQIGPATVKYLDDAAPPQASEGAEQEIAALERVDLSSPAVTVQSSKQGILFDCNCGGPLWVAAKYAGRRGLCKYCGEPVRVPLLPPALSPSGRLRELTPPAREYSSVSGAADFPGAASPIEALAGVIAEATSARRQRSGAPLPSCGVCHSAIEPGEESNACPDCGTKFHTDCWMENYGCSTYGCPQVNALKPAAVVQAEAASIAAAAEAATAAAEEEGSLSPSGMPVEYILIFAAVIASLVGALLFGIFNVAVAIAALVMMLRKNPQRRRGLLAVALLLALVGIAVDLAVSDFWWMAGRHLPAAL